MNKLLKYSNIQGSTIEVPSQYAKERATCTVHAIAIAFDLPYLLAHGLLLIHGRKRNKGHSLSSFLLDHPILNARSHEQVVLLPNTKLLVQTAQMCFPIGTYLITIHRHAFTMIDGIIYDPAFPLVNAKSEILNLTKIISVKD